MELYKFLFYRSEHDKGNNNLSKELIHAYSFNEAIKIWKVEFNLHESLIYSIDKHKN